MSKSNMPTVCRGVNGNGEIVLVLKKGSVGVQLSNDEAMYITKMLGLFCGIKNVNGELQCDKKANENSTKEKPLGV
ncbi:hypothetical protein QT384_01510 [Arcobacter cryaerophilus gv. pseudocryaerophilus]|uniref:Uncharacterized protein n=3 Tax=Arcobacteraceae TaxID=2808963 RepID=A0AA96IIX0_9BACT|nr:hypothetical protein RMP68_00160 [Arcobacter sp. AZ-2023]WNL36486.1 hypothetical protein RMQ66_01510 [Arcobacter sp. AZ-2023]WPD12202.1 hypothetical protein QT384_01510 [Arcobacter sp. DSM 115960]